MTLQFTPVYRDEHYERLHNSFDEIGQALANELDYQLWHMMQMHAPEGFYHGLAAHITAWIRNVAMREQEHIDHLISICLMLEDEGLIVQDTNNGAPVWRVPR